MTNALANLGRWVTERVDMSDLGSAMKLMGQGMLGIFVVMAVISVIVFLLTKIPAKK